MSTPKRTRVREDEEKVIAEFTKPQMVLASVVALLAACCCILVGIVIGRADPSLHDSVPQATQQQAAETTSTDTPPATPSGGAGEGTQVSPRTDTLPRVVSPRNASRADQPITEIQPLPVPGQQAPAPESSTPAPPAPATTTAPAVTPEAASAPDAPVYVAKSPELLTGTPPPAPVETSPATPPPPEAAPPVAPVVERGAWGIQLAAFFGDDQVKRAEEYQRRLKDNASLSSMIIKDTAKNCHQVCIVGYKDRAAAQSACADLRKRPQFKEAFPRELPAQ